MDAARREALRVALEILEALLREPQLVGGVVDREVRAVAEPRRLAAQDAPAGGVECHDPRRARRWPDEILDPFAHLGCCLVRERDREDLGRLDADRGKQMCDAARENTRLARARAGDDEYRSFGRQHGFPLRRIQVGEVRLGRRRGHASIVAARLAGPFHRPVPGTVTAPSGLRQIYLRRIARSRCGRLRSRAGLVTVPGTGRVSSGLALP